MLEVKVEFLLKELARKLFQDKNVSLEDLARTTGLSVEFIKTALEGLGVRTENNIVTEELPWLIIKSWMSNYDIASLALSSGWSTFEELCSRIAELNGFQVHRNYRFSLGGKRHEIDVLAYRENMLLAIDCKLWKRAPRSALKRAAQAQLARTSSLAKILSSGTPFPWRLANPTYIFPLVTNLYDTGAIIEEGVLIVGLREFKNILDNASYLALVDIGCKPLRIEPPGLL